MVEAVDKAKFSAAIFRRGHKQELFGDGEEDDEEQIELNDKLNDLHSIWGLPRTG